MNCVIVLRSLRSIENMSGALVAKVAALPSCVIWYVLVTWPVFIMVILFVARSHAQMSIVACGAVARKSSVIAAAVPVWIARIIVVSIMAVYIIIKIG